ncbi:hypothetical protein [Mycobacteroides abscessus]|uniref:hypothetical protein n=1 Tax=Mycobacteroides abscessus TaxID=36809 RepID=UPI0009A8B507|nr:hypothetical protein [Mycobacteroides abscessus]SKH86592.1 Uncharacterised protein [Mycobacteroides abscessus subsp. massiliense]SKH90912.1 Uncharacterised protein [Mycobacteroides abscessus subsp. massiliense]SKI12196.1 Uncharacterised protein [Mycobacteroides abscessus subsp. massiliense]SKK23864.1 Uncharacterised protein [Mycobacteroides abscessus subsp. massiliense]SKK29352.1 Uncharacterised protein [Mycobacteroides abscessus subsp. massiliense]
MAAPVSTWQKVNALMDTIGVHLERAATDFEALYKSNINDSGVRRIYFELSRRISEKYPVSKPQATEPPNDDPDSEEFKEWLVNDPECRWECGYREVVQELGSIQARIIVSRNQQRGVDLVADIVARTLPPIEPRKAS